MTVTTNELGQQNLFAKEPQMVVESYNRKGLFSPMQQREMYNGRGIYDGGHLRIPFICYYWQTLFWHFLMTEIVFTVTAVSFLVLLSYSVQQLSETY